MKPRYPVALLTTEDIRIWRAVRDKIDPECEVDARAAAMLADRRDADLMLYLARMHELPQPLALRGWANAHIMLKAAADWTINITHAHKG